MMNAIQISLARNALGLDGVVRTTTRNRFIANPSHFDHTAWMEMVASGDATRLPPSQKGIGTDDTFRMTESGARSVLKPGERLSPEDFR